MDLLKSDLHRRKNKKNVKWVHLICLMEAKYNYLETFHQNKVYLKDLKFWNLSALKVNTTWGSKYTCPFTTSKRMRLTVHWISIWVLLMKKYMDLQQCCNTKRQTVKIYCKMKDQWQVKILVATKKVSTWVQAKWKLLNHKTHWRIHQAADLKPRRFKEVTKKWKTLIATK